MSYQHVSSRLDGRCNFTASETAAGNTVIWDKVLLASANHLSAAQEQRHT